MAGYLPAAAVTYMESPGCLISHFLAEDAAPARHHDSRSGT